MTNAVPHPKVMIVGAGAMGLTLGHHLQVASAEITFLARAARAPDLARAQILYSHDDGSLKSFAGFRVVTAAPSAGQGFDYVIVTLDGAATTSADGAALLAGLGSAIVDAGTVMIGGGVGLSLRETYLRVTGLPADRLLMGVLGSFAYQVARTDLPIHRPTNPAKLARADIAYRHYAKAGFLLENRAPAAAKRFAALYDANGAARCILMQPHLYDIMSNAPFPIFAASELLGWPSARGLRKHGEVWRLTVRAVREIARLDRHGWRGQLAGLALTEGMIGAMLQALERRTRPLDLPAFNAFQHGAKVAAQDRAIMQACVAAGEREGKPMVALRELLARLDAARRA